MTLHELKIWPEFFSKILDGSKTFELRYNDRRFKVDDEVMLQEYEPSNGLLTGRAVLVLITYILISDNCCVGERDPLWGISLGYCIFSFKIVHVVTGEGHP